MHLHLSLPAEIETLVGVRLHSAGAVDARVATQPPGTTAADGEDDSEETSALGAVMSLLPLIALAVGAYYLLIRPARKRQRDQAALSQSVGVGDEVLLTSGVVGFISAKDDETGVFWVEIDDDVQVRVVPAAISRKWTPTPTTSAATAPAETSDDGDVDVGDDVDDVIDGADDGVESATSDVTPSAPSKPGVKGRSKAAPATSGTADNTGVDDPA